MGNESKEDLQSNFNKATDLKDLVAYQAGSVVSKQIIDRKTGNVTLFAFDRGQKLSEHTAPYDAFVYVFEGAADIYISGTPNRLKSGQFIVMPANIPHAIDAVENFKMMLVMIKE